MEPLSREAAEQIVRDALVELEVDPSWIVPEAALVETLGIDSLGLIELTRMIEARFRTDVPQRRAERVRTVGDVVDLVVELSEQGAVAAQGAPR